MDGELLARFDAQAVEGHVIKALREQLVLCLTEGFHLTALLVDVARIAQGDVDLFADGGRKPDVTRVDFGQIIIEDAGAAEEVGRADAAGCGLLTVFIRYFGGYPEGVSYSILIMNCCVWLIDMVGKPGRYGVTKEMKAAAKAAKKAGKEG